VGHEFDDPDNRPHFFARLAEDLVHMVLLVDERLDVVYANAAVREVGGYEPEDLIGRNAIELVHPDDLEIALSGMSDMDTSSQRQLSAVPLHVRLLRADGTYGPVEVRGSTFLDDPRIRGIAIKARRADARTHIDQFLNLLLTTTEANAHDVLHEVAAAVHYDVRAAGVSVLYGWDGSSFTEDASYLVDPAARSLVRDADDRSMPWLLAGDRRALAVVDDLESSPAMSSLHATDLRACWAFPVDAAEPARLGTIVVWRRFLGAPAFTVQLHIERYRRFVELAMHRWESERLLRYAAEHDHLTGLANRALLHRHMRRHEDASSPGVYTVVGIDLDGFKPVNDTYGHAAGDDLLRVVAARLRANARTTDVVARLGGDEFCVVSDTTTSIEAAEQMGARILAALSEPVSVVGGTVRITASIGVTLGHAGESVDEAIRRADEAMYEAKRGGKGRVRRSASSAA